MGNRVTQAHRRIGALILTILVVLLLGKLVYEKNSGKMVEDNALVTEDLLKTMSVSGELLLRTQGKGAVFLSADETHLFFLENFKGWVAKKETSPLDLEPNLTLYLSLAGNYKVMFYESNPELAMVQRMNHYQYFKIPKGTYEKLTFEYSIRSYLVFEPLVAAIADGELSDRESVNDTPMNVEYKTAQIGNFTYYFYKEQGKYYVEAPYFFIKELSKDVYEKAIAAIPQ